MFLIPQDIQNIVEVKLTTNTISEMALKNAIDEIMYVVSNYCNIKVDRIPVSLKYTIANMVIDFLQMQSMDSADIVSGLKVGIGCVAKVKTGDAEVQFTSKGNGTGAHVNNIDSIAMNYKAQLNKHRKFSW